jgi:tRNA (guanine-N7-)-methyltransferase
MRFFNTAGPCNPDTQYILNSKELPWPTDWNALFGRSAPLLVEIGFGNGQFLIELARSRPWANVIGLEISLPSLRKAEKKLKTAGLANARILQADAQLFLWAYCSPQSLHEVTINFPDPWPKERQIHRRLINEQFLDLLASRLGAGGKLDIATDHPDYQTAVVESLLATPYFESRLETLFVVKDDERIRTKYELKAIAEGRTCHYYKWQRNTIPAPNGFPIPTEQPMPHAVLQSPLTLPQISEQFKPFQAAAGQTHANFLEAFQSTDDGTLLVEVYVVEVPLKQRVGLAIRQRADGRLVIGLHEIGFPRPTAGIQLAVKHLAEWVATLHPETEIVHHNLAEK